MICASYHVRVSRVCCWFPEEAAVTSVEWQLVSGCWHLLIEFGLLHDRGVIMRVTILTLKYRLEYLII
jgi:hypothetical protein